MEHIFFEVQLCIEMLIFKEKHVFPILIILCLATSLFHPVPSRPVKNFSMQCLVSPQRSIKMNPSSVPLRGKNFKSEAFEAYMYDVRIVKFSISTVSYTAHSLQAHSYSKKDGAREREREMKRESFPYKTSENTL